MTIHMLDQDPKLCASYLDDRALDNMIREIAQVLCNVHMLVCDSNKCTHDDVHHFKQWYKYSPEKTIEETILKCKFSVWTSECRANYEWMIKLGMACCREYEHRYEDEEQEGQVNATVEYAQNMGAIVWARDNVPDLPLSWNNNNLNNDKDCSPFPLVMPTRYQQTSVGESTHYTQNYRNYYKAKVKDDAKWSRRERPEWLDN